MMKKGAIFILIFSFAIFSISFISAVEFNINANYSQGETVIAKISGNFITPVTKDNIFFYEGHVNLPLEYDVTKINSDYYIYALLADKSAGNYSVQIENVKYMNGSQIAEADIARDFSITNITADFSVKPGFAVSSGEFSIELQNLKDNEISVDINTASNGSQRNIFILPSNTQQASVSLSSGEIKKINFAAGNGNPSLQNIELKTANLTYKIPVYIYSSGIQEEPAFRLEPSEMTLSIPTDSIIKRTIFLYNTGSSEIKNITLSFSDEIKAFVNLSQYNIETLDANSNFPVELSFLSPAEIEVDGNLKAMTENFIAYSQISLKFLNNYTPSNENEQSSTKTCAELNGIICSQAEKCDMAIIYAKDNVCCPGKCLKNQGTSSTGKIIGILIFVIVAAALLWFYFRRFRKAKKPINLLEIAKGKRY